MKVIDASAILAVLLKEPEAAQIAMLTAGERLVAPHLLSFEITNVCVTNAKKFPDREKSLLDAIMDFEKFDIEFHEADITETFKLARRHSLTGYDASYLWLARELDLELVTLDDDLQKAFAER
jgi:predicted nucleic acid-binding protein